MNILQKNVSYYKNVGDKTGTPVQLYSFLTSAKHAGKVAELRAAVAAGLDAEAISALKKSLPACTVSGLFAERSASGLIEHSGFMAIDIDKKDNTHLTNFADVKSELCKLKQVAYCGLSCSGRGYFALIRLAYPDKHRAQFDALQSIFASWGLTIDNACKDVCRLRFYSYDAEAYFNLSAEPFTGVTVNNGNGTVNNGKKHTLPYFTVYRNEKSNITDAEKLNELLRWCNATHTDITGNYRAWYEIGAGLASELGEAGRDIFHDLSGHYAGYDYLKTDKQYNYCLKHQHSFTLASVFHYAKLAGWQGVTVNGNGTVSNGKRTVNNALPRHITDAEKLAAMQAINPNLSELCTRLGLDIKQE